MKNLVDKLYSTHSLTDDEFLALLNSSDPGLQSYIFSKARQSYYSIHENDIYLSGIIDIANFCKYDCHFCNLRLSNTETKKFQLDKDTILSYIEKAYKNGIKSFIFRSGDMGNTFDQKIYDIIKYTKEKYSDIVVTLNIGERTKEEYKRFYEAGASVCMCNIMSTDEELFRILHPSTISYEKKMASYNDLLDIGFKVGVSLFVGAPYQNMVHILKDFKFLLEKKPFCVVIIPFVPRRMSMFKDFPAVSHEFAAKITSLIRIMLPNTIMPNNMHILSNSKDIIKLGILTGCNVITPCISDSTSDDFLYNHNDIMEVKHQSPNSVNNLKRFYTKLGYNLVTDIDKLK